MTRKKDFDRLFRFGRRHRGRLFTVLVYPRKNDGTVRFAFQVKRKLGSSVVRNRVRRQLREAARRIVPSIAGAWDIVIFVRCEAIGGKFKELEQELRISLERLGCFRRKRAAGGTEDVLA